MSISIHIRGLDTMFFRNSFPFSAGDDRFAESVFPSPLTVYGAVGSWHIESQGRALGEFVDQGKKLFPKLGDYSENLSDAEFKIRGPLPTYQGELYFPAPANLFVLSDSMSTHQIGLPEEKNGANIYRWDLGDDLRPIELPEREDMVQLDGYLPIENMKAYLTDPESLSTIESRPRSAFWEEQWRVGQRIVPDTKTVEEGKLYSSMHFRFKDDVHCKKAPEKAGFYVEAESLGKSDLPSKATCMGGERRGVRIDVEEIGDSMFSDDAAIREGIENHKRFFLYLATPAIFKRGWRGEWREGKFQGTRLAAAAVKKTECVSGWKRAAKGAGGGPRPVKRMVPAGSVYFFEIEPPEVFDAKAFVDTYHWNESVSDEYPDAGFGTALVGVWKPRDRKEHA